MPAYTAAKAIKIDAGTGDVLGVAAAAGLRLMGVCVQEVAGSAAAAALLIRNGVSVAGPIIWAREVAADGSHCDWFGPQGIDSPDGIFIDRSAGTTQVIVYYQITPNVNSS